MMKKVIHYCWFGGKEKPDLVKKCIRSWQKFFPDFEIKEWNESNFDVNCNNYVKQAYERKKYAFVADYARFWVLEKEGGIYFDTDVEVIRSFDELLLDDAFVGFETNEFVNPGQVLYSRKENNVIINKTKEWYENASFLDDNGNIIPHTVCTVFSNILKEYGFEPNGKLQNCDGMVIYPIDYFNPYDDATGKLNKTKNTYTIHWYAKSWFSKKQRVRSKITQVFHRVFGKDCFKWIKKESQKNQSIVKRVFVVGYSENKGGVENYIDLLSSNLSKNNFQIFYSLPFMVIDGKRWNRPKNRHNYIKYFFFWRKFFKHNNFDAIYYNTCDIVSIDVLKFAKKAGVPVRIIHSHSSSNQRKLNYWHKKQELKNRKNLGNYATHFLACSKVAGEWMFGEKRNFRIINNAIDLCKFQYSLETREKYRKELDLEDKLIIGMVGRLSDEKNPEFGINVFGALHKICPNSVLLIIGEGERKESVIKEIAKLGLEKEIKLLGRREDVNKLMSAMDCLLLTSKFEGFPFVLIEAQASDLPCLVSNTVSRETDLIGNIEFVGLDESYDKWAEKIINATANKERGDKKNLLREKGYDIKGNIKYIEKVLLGDDSI